MLVLTLALLTLPAGPPADAAGYLWLRGEPKPPSASETLHARFGEPLGYRRVAVATGSFAHWLRHLPLLPEGSPVLAHDGARVAAPAVAVVNLDVGERDLQQCADSIIRLRAEFLFASGRPDEIAFHFTNGDHARFSKWSAGWRPRLIGTSKVVWERKASPSADHASLRAYLDAVFLWAGTASLAEHTARASFVDARAGDFVVLGGFPGHAVIILDVAVAPDGRRKALLGQGFMPAQRFHVLRAPDSSAWFDLPDDGGLLTPSWPTPFGADSLRRFDAAR